MKGKKMVFAVILALIVCLVLIPTCAFADDEQQSAATENTGDNLVAESPATGGDDPSGAPDGGDGSGAGSGSGDADLGNSGSEDGNGGSGGNVGGGDAGTPGSAEGSTENGADSDDEEGAKQPESGDKEEDYQPASGDEDSSEDSNVTEEENNAEEAVQLTASAPAVVYTEPTLQDQINNAGTKEITIVLNKDYTESITIGKDQNVILDLNGWTLRNKDGDNTIWNEGTLTIRDSSEAKTGTVLAENTVDGKGALVNIGTATLESGTFIRKNLGSDGTWYAIKNHGTMTIEEGVNVEWENSLSSLIANGWYNGSNSLSSPQAGDYVAHTGDKVAKLIINGGKFSGCLNTIKNDDWGVLEINGGTFKNNRQAAIFNVNVATITGGHFEGNGSYSIINRAYKCDYMRGDLTIIGGSFDGAIKWSDNGSQNITGGIYTDENVKTIVDEDTVIVESNGKYAVGESGYDLAKDGGTVTVVKAPAKAPIDDVPAGVTIVNDTDDSIFVNGVEVKPGEKYVVPVVESKTASTAASAPLYAKYLVLEGKGQQWTDGDLEFVLNSNAVVKVLIDGVEVEFTVAEDGTVTVASAVIEALEAGTHEIQFIFADGSCMTTFTK